MADPVALLAPARTPEEIERFRGFLRHIADGLYAVPADVRQAYLDELGIKATVNELMTPEEIRTLFAICSLSWAEAIIASGRVKRSAGADGPPRA